MRNFKLNLFLIALLSCNMITPVEWTEQKQAALVVTSLAAACSLYNYIPSCFDQPEEFYVKFSFPNAQLWYEEMITKYPQAYLDKKSFMQARYGVSKEQIEWSMLSNNIYVPQNWLTCLEVA